MKTLAVDKYQRIRLPGVKAGQRLAYENHGDGRFTLAVVHPVEPKPGKMRLVKEGGYTVGITDRSITPEQIRELQAELP